MVVLDRVREDIHENKKLNVHLFGCLKKALYKPAGFFKGFLFPLVGSGNATPEIFDSHMSTEQSPDTPWNRYLHFA
jgi:hypothetical protein